MQNECEALPGVAYPGVWDNRSTINTKTGYDDDDLVYYIFNLFVFCLQADVVGPLLLNTSLLLILMTD